MMPSGTISREKAFQYVIRPANYLETSYCFSEVILTHSLKII